MNFIKIFLFSTIFLFISQDQNRLDTKSLINDKIEIKIPVDFEIMTDELLELKYPSQNRPTFVYTNKSGGINVAFTKSKTKFSQDDILPFKDMMVRTFTKNYPTAEWINKGVKQINGRKVGFLELITPAIDTKIYNLMFFTDLDGQLLLCSFNCTHKNMNDWKPTAKEIMESLKIK